MELASCLKLPRDVLYNFLLKDYLSYISFLLKSLKSVQISIWNRKITPEVLRIDQHCEKMLDKLATKSFFSVRFCVAALPSLLPYR